LDLQVAELAARDVRREHGDPPAVGVGEAELRAGVRPFAAGDHSHPDGPGLPGAGWDVAGELGDLHAVAGEPVRVQGSLPCLARELGQCLQDRGPATQPDGVLQVQLVQVLDESVRPGTAVTQTSNRAWSSFGTCSKGLGEDGDVVGGVVGVRLPRSQQPGQALSGATFAVIGEGQDWGEPETSLEGRLGAFCPGVLRSRHRFCSCLRADRVRAAR
jgi:hypothetical protein